MLPATNGSDQPWAGIHMTLGGPIASLEPLNAPATKQKGVPKGTPFMLKLKTSVQSVNQITQLKRAR